MNIELPSKWDDWLKGWNKLIEEYYEVPYNSDGKQNAENKYKDYENALFKKGFKLRDEIIDAAKEGSYGKITVLLKTLQKQFNTNCDRGIGGRCAPSPKDYQFYVSTPNKDKETPLMIAIENGHAGTVRLLLENGAYQGFMFDPNIDIFTDEFKTIQDNIPSESYFKRESHKVSFADRERDEIFYLNQNKDGLTPLMYASMKGQKDIVKLLLVNNDNFKNVKDKDGKTARMYASSEGHEDIVSIFSKYKYNTNEKNGGRRQTRKHKVSKKRKTIMYK